MPEGGCGKPIERDAQGRPTKWQLVKAHPTEKHPGYFNCLGADMAFSTCCVPNKLPKDGTLTLTNKKDDPQRYNILCRDTNPGATGLLPVACKLHQ
ncbi:hypothetical protein PGT21_034403 [Puccinia graminis f. sp. tritici]|uniref:Uncharacterized protein n=1 Tax=Puccinia graminis f. sp. tritici TaxID=56615 RepID=A0A5B0P9W7_PUCGR|nr:hypothetical protein PGT21_034403 [Puccinia graminis f. sp. tritici]KAA1125650.1 hypothetical protein PGTUg99_017284 [Puccinia graminis f. sp. tritici]